MNYDGLSALLTACALLLTALGGILVPIVTHKRKDDDDDRDVVRLKEQLLELLQEQNEDKDAEISRLKLLLEEE